MKRVLLIMAGIVLLASSCKKGEPDTPTPSTPTTDYMQLKVGNYWVYDRYTVDSLGNETISSASDSNIIVGDTIIRDELFFKKVHNHASLPMTYLRDSSGYLIYDQGEILFSDHDFSNILRADTVGSNYFYIEYSMMQSDTSTVVPLGTYDALTYRGKVIPLEPEYPFGINYLYYFYADSLGMIKSSYYYGSCPYIRTEMRLARFGNIDIGKSQDISW
jgi:hypothetical protein